MVNFIQDFLIEIFYEGAYSMKVIVFLEIGHWLKILCAS